MNRKFNSLAGCLCLFCHANPVAANDENWYLNIGLAASYFDEDASISLGGSVVPGANATASKGQTVSFEFGYRFQNDWAVSFFGGIPPTADLNGTGPLAGTALGSAKYAPAVLSAHYHFAPRDAKFQPYLGAGISYAFIFEESDGAIQGLEVDDTMGPVIQVGFESPISERYSFFFDVKKFFLSTEAKGQVGATPAFADIDLDPVIVSTGISFRW